LLCAFGMMGLAAVNQEFGLPNIDSFMVENRKNPDGAQETEVKGTFDMRGILVSGKSAIRSKSLIKGFNVVIPASIGRTVTALEAAEAEYIPAREDDKR